LKPHKSEAIVLHTYPSRERDKLVVFLTPEQGKLRGFAYGARSMRSRYGAALEPLAKINVSYLEKENEEALRLDGAELIRSLFPAQQNLRASFAATYLAESVDVFAQPNEASPLLFRLLDSCCEALLDEIDPRIVVAYFEVWILKLQGIFPSLKECHECGAPFEGPLYFDERRAGFVCDGCTERDSEILANEVRDVLINVMRSNITDFAKSSPRKDLIFEVRSLSRRLRRHFLGHELKSHEVMQRVL
jgi:DNA repair protein RecO (recombination protein O)